MACFGIHTSEIRKPQLAGIQRRSETLTSGMFYTNLKKSQTFTVSGRKSATSASSMCILILNLRRESDITFRIDFIGHQSPVLLNICSVKQLLVNHGRLGVLVRVPSG